MKSLHKIWLVAIGECAGAIRSRRALVVILLYLATAVFCMHGTISALGKMEDELVTMLRLPKSEQTGIVSATIWKSAPFRRIVRQNVNELVFDDISGKHPVELVYAWFAFLFAPMLVVLVSGNRISDDLRSGAARYMIVRASRAEWALGKFIGQAMMIGISLAISATGAWIVATIRLSGIGAGELLPAMFNWGLRAWIYSLSWLGIVLGISQITDSGSRSTSIGFCAVFVFSILAPLLSIFDKFDDWRMYLVNLDAIIPQSAKSSLWRSSSSVLITGTCHLLAIGFSYFTLGYLRLRRRDA